jgi:MFS family permease
MANRSGSLTRAPVSGSRWNRQIDASSLGTLSSGTTSTFTDFGAILAGFLVRPFGAIIFGRVGDLAGAQGVSCHHYGHGHHDVGWLLPTFGSHTVPGVGTVAGIGWLAPILLVSLRLLQGLALGGEYGGAATYVAEHSRQTERRSTTSYIQTTFKRRRSSACSWLCW